MQIQIGSKLFDLYFCTKNVYDPQTDKFHPNGFRVRFLRYCYSRKNGLRNLRHVPNCLYRSSEPH